MSDRYGGSHAQPISQPTSTSSTLSPYNIEFVDPQTANPRSQIQRHTANHAVQQRREAARQRLQREGVRPRKLEWTRRSSADVSTTASDTPSSPSASASFGYQRSSSDESIPRYASTLPVSRPPSEVTLTVGMVMYTPGDETWLEYYSSSRCLRTSHRLYFHRLYQRLRGEPSAAYLIMAYAAATRATTRHLDADRENDKLAAERYKNKGIGFINARNLRQAVRAASDDNIQAVLLLIAYENKWGAPDQADLHARGLHSMVEARGGIKAFDEPLGQQLRWLEMAGNGALLLDCGPSCVQEMFLAAPGTVPPGQRLMEVAREPYSINTSIFVVDDQVTRHRLAQTFCTHLKAFREQQHIARIRAIFIPDSTVNKTFQTTMEKHPSRNWDKVSSQCRLVCLFFVHALIASGRTLEEAKDTVEDVVCRHLKEDFDVGEENSIGLLWNFTYALQSWHESNARVIASVLEMVAAARYLSDYTKHMVDTELFDRVLYNYAHIEVAEGAITRDIVSRPDVGLVPTNAAQE